MGRGRPLAPPPAPLFCIWLHPQPLFCTQAPVKIRDWPELTPFHQPAIRQAVTSRLDNQSHIYKIFHANKLIGQVSLHCSTNGNPRSSWRRQIVERIGLAQFISLKRIPLKANSPSQDHSGALMPPGPRNAPTYLPLANKSAHLDEAPIYQ